MRLIHSFFSCSYLQVTDAEAQAVLDELFGKGNSGNKSDESSTASHDARMQPTTAATLQKAARTAKLAVGLDRSGPSAAGKARMEYEKVNRLALEIDFWFSLYPPEVQSLLMPCVSNIVSSA